MIRTALVSCLALVATLGFATAQGLGVSSLSTPVTPEDVAAAIAAGVAAPGVKLAAIPATGPGTGLCRISVLPSELITSGGITGTAGTCSRIVQCGTSAAYTVVQFNLGGGC